MTFKSIFATSFLAVSLSFSIPQFAIAQDLSEAIEAYDADDYASALPLFKSLAGQGDDDAMWYLGKMYDNGWGVTQSDEQAFTWFERAAKLGDSDAQWEVALMYDIGQWVDEDQDKAFEWYLEAAENGRYSAMNEIGDRYRSGDSGVKKSEKKASKWYKIAAEAGHGEAQANYGVQHEFGNGGLKQSDEKALYWYRLSAEQGTALGQAYLGEMYESGTGVDEDLVEARRLYELAAAQDNEYAKERLAEMGSSGTSSQSSSAASSGEMSAEEAVAFMTDSITQTKFDNARRYSQQEDYDKAFKLFYELATENNHARSQYFVGGMSEMGYGTTQSWEEAVKWTRKSAEAGDEEGEYALAVYYFNGNPVIPQDRLKALELYQQSARNGFKPSQDFLTDHGQTW